MSDRSEPLDYLSEMAAAIRQFLSIADGHNETMIAAKLAECLDCIEVRTQTIEKQR